MDLGNVSAPAEGRLLDAARRGDGDAFGRVVAPYRTELTAHCYRMLGSVQDAEDALQDTLLGAWQGIAGFEGRSSLRSWLYRIATNACLRLLTRAGRRVLAAGHLPAVTTVHDLGDPLPVETWVEPCPDGLLQGHPVDPQARYELRETVELAFVAALQHLPASQRAVLILRDVLAFSAAEVAAQLDTTVAAVNSALQRARASLDQRLPRVSQQAQLRALGDAGQRALLDALVAAWERADVAAILELLVEDARFAMPPLPAWFHGHADVGRFLAERVFATQWRLVPASAACQLAFAAYQRQPDGGYLLGALNVLTLRDGRIAEMTAFLDSGIHARFGLAPEPPA